MRTPRVLNRHFYYPNKLHVYIQVQFLSQAPGTTRMQVGEGEGKRGLKTTRSIQVCIKRAASLKNLALLG